MQCNVNDEYYIYNNEINCCFNKIYTLQIFQYYLEDKINPNSFKMETGVINVGEPIILTKEALVEMGPKCDCKIQCNSQCWNLATDYICSLNTCNA